MKWKWALPPAERIGIEAAMIRQAISCDICGAEKKQTNHWFVAYTHAGELRVSGWGVQGRVRAGSKHLCGQTCLHKLVDEFIATGATGRVHTPKSSRRNSLSTSYGRSLRECTPKSRLFPAVVLVNSDVVDTLRVVKKTRIASCCARDEGGPCGTFVAITK